MVELKKLYAVRDRASGYFLRGKYLAEDGDVQLYSNPGPAKGLITKLKKTEYYNTGEAGYYASNLEVVTMRLVPEIGY